MTYFDYYLRGVDRDATRAALLAAGLALEVVFPGGEIQRFPAEGVSISTVGTIYEGGAWSEGGQEIQAPTPTPGWHVNLRLERPLTESEREHLGGMLIEPAPATPYRVWA